MRKSFHDIWCTLDARVLMLMGDDYDDLTSQIRRPYISLNSPEVTKNPDRMDRFSSLLKEKLLKIL